MLEELCLTVPLRRKLCEQEASRCIFHPCIARLLVRPRNADEDLTERIAKFCCRSSRLVCSRECVGRICRIGKAMSKSQHLSQLASIGISAYGLRWAGAGLQSHQMGFLPLGRTGVGTVAGVRVVGPQGALAPRIQPACRQRVAGRCIWLKLGISAVSACVWRPCPASETCVSLPGLCIRGCLDQHRLEPDPRPSG